MGNAASTSGGVCTDVDTTSWQADGATTKSDFVREMKVIKRREESSNVARDKDELRTDEIPLVKESWQFIRPNITEVLTTAFIALFLENLEIKDKFEAFRGYTIEDLRTIKAGQGIENPLQRFIPLVARALNKVVMHVDDMAEIIVYIEFIGRTHHKNGILPREISLFGPFFFASSLRFLPSPLQQRPYRQAWVRLFLVVSALMKRGYPHEEVLLNAEERHLVTKTYRLVRGQMTDIGMLTFLSMFKTHSSSKAYFPTIKDSPLEDPIMKEQLQDHGLRLMKVLDRVLSELGSSGTDSYLSKLGSMHQKMKLDSRFLEVMGPIFTETIRPVLLEEGVWNLHIRDAWLHLFRVIVTKMKKGYRVRRVNKKVTMESTAGGDKTPGKVIK